MMKGLQLESERLVLKVLDDSYADKVLDYFNRNSDFLNRWESIKTAEFYTLDFQKQQLKNELKKMEDGKLLKVWIFEKEDIEFDNIIGSIALNEIIRGCFQSCFLSYKMDQRKTNIGYMTEGVKRIVKYAFNDLKLHRIEGNIIPNNTASLKVVEKLGFYNEGLAKKYLKINGQWQDHIHMVLLNDEME